MENIIIGLGGNQGNVQNILRDALEKINNEIGKVILTSSVYQTQAWGVENQPDFLNMVISINTNMLPIELLRACLLIEKELGRNRQGKKKWSERIIDIDVLFYNDELVQTPELTIPHPFVQERNFVLYPLAEILPNNTHPILKRTFTELKETTKDTQKVTLLRNNTK